jgi:hypothetical protein
MRDKFTAIFVGGDRDGSSVELDGIYPIVHSILEAANAGGIILAKRTKVTYTLISHGPPLRYEVAT